MARGQGWSLCFKSRSARQTHLPGWTSTLCPSQPPRLPKTCNRGREILSSFTISILTFTEQLTYLCKDVSVNSQNTGFPQFYNKNLREIFWVRYALLWCCRLLEIILSKLSNSTRNLDPKESLSCLENSCTGHL